MESPIQTIQIDVGSRYLFFISTPDQTAKEAEEIARSARVQLEHWIKSGEQFGVFALHGGISIKVERLEDDPKD